MKYFNTLKTSQKISLSFSLFSFLMLVFLLVSINIIYFFIWYNDQKEMSFSDMDTNYLFLQSNGNYNPQEFQKFLLTKNTIIIPEDENAEMICSPGVAASIHGDVEKIKNKLFYTQDDKTYFIYSQYFDGIGEVKVFFDTTSLLYSQKRIIQISLVIIIASFFLSLFLGNIVSKRLLRPLTSLAKKVKDVDISSYSSDAQSSEKNDDEIAILDHTLNDAFLRIRNQTDQLKQFLTDVSHECKTPLMVMGSELDVFEKKLQKSGKDTGKTQELLTNMRNQIHKLNGLLETLFFLSRIEENPGCLVKNSVNFESTITNKIEEIAKNFPQKQLDYSLNIQPHLTYEVEENTFGILLENLVSNAIKFAPDSVKIVVEADAKGFSIRDNGPGMSEEEQEKIWNKFYRSNTNLEGFGIGLYLVQRIIEMYDWSIELDSETGQGTQFYIQVS